MEVPQLNRIDAAGSRTQDQSGLDGSDLLRNAFATVRNLNAQEFPDKKFAIVRDPQSHKFVIRVIDRATGDVLDQFPPEDILKMLSQYNAVAEPNQESTK